MISKINIDEQNVNFHLMKLIQMYKDHLAAFEISYIFTNNVIIRPPSI